MSDVKIYTVMSDELSPPIHDDSFCTDMVRFSDYASLQAERDALAAENSSIKAMNDCLSEELRGYESDGAFDGPLMHLLWWKAQTPATDAFVREQMAKGMEAFAKASSDKASSCSLKVHAGYWTHAKESAQDFAAKLRAGEAV